MKWGSKGGRHNIKLQRRENAAKKRKEALFKKKGHHLIRVKRSKPMYEKDAMNDKSVSTPKEPRRSIRLRRKLILLEDNSSEEKIEGDEGISEE